MSERFYVTRPLQPGEVVLEGDEAHHLATVCRLRPGDRVSLFNGDGREYPAEVTAVLPSRRDTRVTLRVLTVETPQRELPFRLEVAVPLPKGDRAQFLAEKLTELGVTRLVPLRTARSVVQPREARLDRLQRQVIEASKQCGRNRLMEVAPLTAWTDYCTHAAFSGLRLVAHPGGGALPARGGQDVYLGLGPEGGFTDEEIQTALTAGWQAVGLGPRILRVETAALVAAALAAR